MQSNFKNLVVSMMAVVLLTACAEAPNNELASAQSSIDTIVSEGAEIYTPEQLKSINNKLEEAKAELKVQEGNFFKNYDLAKHTLAQVKSDADALKGQIAQRKEELKVAATTALSEAVAALTEAKAMLEVAPQGKGSLADLQAMKSDVVGLEAELEGIQPQIDSGEYIAAAEKANAVAARAMTINSDISQAREKIAAAKKK